MDASHGVISLPSDSFSGVGRLFVTADAGRTWNEVSTAGHLGDLVTVGGRLWASVVPLDCSEGSACPTSIATSADDGRTWSTAPGRLPDAGAQILPLSDNVALAASTRVWRTTDAGVSWHELADPCPTDVPRAGSRTVRVELAGGPQGLWAACEIVILPTAYVDPIATLMYRSADGGTTWQETRSAPPAQYWPTAGPSPDRAITALDANTAWLSLSEATGPGSSNHPEVVATVDGGETWHIVFASTAPVSSAAVQNFLVTFGDTHHGWVVGQNPYRTQDGGMHWTLRPLASPSGR